MDYEWVFSADAVDWAQLVELYRIAPLGQKTTDELRVCFANSRYVCFVYDGERLVGAGRALADGLDCSYLADIAVHPEYQGTGIGKSIVNRLVELSARHSKIILYAAPGKEDFYRKLGFKRMTTAMALFRDQDAACARGALEE